MKRQHFLTVTLVLTAIALHGASSKSERSTDAAGVLSCVGQDLDVRRSR